MIRKHIHNIKGKYQMRIQLLMIKCEWIDAFLNVFRKFPKKKKTWYLDSEQQLGAKHDHP